MSNSKDILKKSIYDFTFNSFKELHESNKRFVFSPISLITALSMAYAGSKGETLEEFCKVVNSDNNSNETHEYFLELINSLKEIPENSELALTLANKIYVAHNFKILDSYSKLLKEYYEGNFENINFMEQDSANKINEFVSEATNKKITELVTQENFNENTKIVLVNCLYFKGEWAKMFKEYNTYEDLFYETESVHKKMEFMKRNDFLMHFENPDLQLVLLDYCDRRTQFGIILPKNKFQIENVIGNLNGDDLAEMINKVSNKGVELHLPKFKMESAHNFNATQNNLGLKTGFSTAANFSGISNEGPLYISKIVQKVIIDVNEKGTEAAAATGVMIELLSMIYPPEDPIIIKADNPFFFFIIRDNKYILFNGIFGL
uniref:SERPIN domain-containing protein n=1 Tax=Parastrongyloides trichosuri TaxID=131310 RepID=A0A0N4ZTI6_PARTI